MKQEFVISVEIDVDHYAEKMGTDPAQAAIASARAARRSIEAAMEMLNESPLWIRNAWKVER